LLLSFNQRATVQAAVQSCLAQQGEPLEIVFSDDASTDGTHEVLQVMAAAYTGHHRVRVRRNPTNLGIGEHYNRAIADCGGALLVTAAGDDISLPHRVQTLAAAWDAGGQKADLIASHLLSMAPDGTDRGPQGVDDLARWRCADDWVRRRPHVVGASHAFTRRMHEHFGPIRADLPYEDQVMALRACCLGGGITVQEPLVRYRQGGVSAGTTKPLNAEARRQRLRIKYQRQRALYLQVQTDLTTAARTDLWAGKMRTQLHRSELMLGLLDAASWSERSALARQARHTGAGWAWMRALGTQWSALGQSHTRP
jgi:glycosyltransferase involved in cell wall biosynthesis